MKTAGWILWDREKHLPLKALLLRSSVDGDLGVWGFLNSFV